MVDNVTLFRATATDGVSQLDADGVPELVIAARPSRITRRV
jgi:hypothetical protein